MIKHVIENGMLIHKSEGFDFSKKNKIEQMKKDVEKIINIKVEKCFEKDCKKNAILDVIFIDGLKKEHIYSCLGHKNEAINCVEIDKACEAIEILNLAKKLTPAQRKECDAETERIKESRKKAKFPHKFKPAKFTHPNGHPRCVVCGQEERTDGTCRLEKREYEFKFYKLDKKQQIVGGVVYEPDTVDTQGDYTDAGEIEKAMYRFMEKYAGGKAKFKVSHGGKSYSFPIIECFQPEHDMQRGGQKVKKGSWWLMVKVTSDEVWAAVENGKLNAFSMGGTAEKVKKDSWKCEKDWDQDNPDKRRASHLLEYAIRTGKLKKPKRCSKCKREAQLDFHHEDYKDALKGIWLCSSCHKLLHLSERK